MFLQWILRLYPALWRQRYQEEMFALLENYPVTWRTLLDLLRGALDARFDPYFKTTGLLPRSDFAFRLRCVHSTVLWTFPLLYLGFLFFFDDLDDLFFPASRGDSALWKYKAIANTFTAVGFFAFLLLALCLTWILLRQMHWTKERARHLLPLGSSLLIVALLSIYFGLLSTVGCFIPLCIGLSPLSLSFAVARCEVHNRFLYYLLVPVALTVFGMAAQVVFIAMWGCSIWNVPTATVRQMVQAADRHLMFGDRWHLQMLCGLLWVALMAGYAFWRLGWGLIGLHQQAKAGSEPA